MNVTTQECDDGEREEDLTHIFLSCVILSRESFQTVVDRVSFYGFEAGASDHFDDLLFGHLDIVIRFNLVAVSWFAAVDDGAVEVAGAPL